MEARSCRLSEFLGARVSPTRTLRPPLPPVSRLLISAGLAEGGSPEPQTAAGRVARTAGAPRAEAVAKVGPAGPGAAGARGRGWSAGPRSGRGQVEGWSLRRSQAALYCSAFHRPKRVLLAWKGARGALGARLSGFPHHRRPAKRYRLPSSPRRLCLARLGPRGRGLLRWGAGLPRGMGKGGPLHRGAGTAPSEERGSQVGRSLWVSGLGGLVGGAGARVPHLTPPRPVSLQEPGAPPPAMAAGRSPRDCGCWGAPP